MQLEEATLSGMIDDISTQIIFNDHIILVTTGSDVTFDIQTGANPGETITLTSKTIDGANLNASALDVSTAFAASDTLDSIDDALEDVNQARASLGPGQNRLESAINNLTNNVTNLSDAARGSRMLITRRKRRRWPRRRSSARPLRRCSPRRTRAGRRALAAALSRTDKAAG
jgi:flagellin-like hook-associated protein FlgL